MNAPVRYIKDLGHRPAMNDEAHRLRACLPEAADSIHAKLMALFDDPMQDKCELMVCALHAVETTCRQLAAELRNGETTTV